MQVLLGDLVYVDFLAGLPEKFEAAPIRLVALGGELGDIGQIDRDFVIDAEPVLRCRFCCFVLPACLDRNQWRYIQLGVGSVRVVAKRFPLPLAAALGATMLGSVAVRFLDILNEAPEGTNTGLVVEESRKVRGLLPVRRAESKVQLGFRLAAH